MGFRTGAWATCWEVQTKSDTLTIVRLSTSRKEKNSDEYVQDFSKFVAFVGTANAQKAAKLKEKSRIKLGDVEVTSRYDKENNKEYTNFTCYSFEQQDEDKGTSSNEFGNLPDPEEMIVDDSRLPF